MYRSMLIRDSSHGLGAPAGVARGPVSHGAPVLAGQVPADASSSATGDDYDKMQMGLVGFLILALVVLTAIKSVPPS